MARTWPFLLYIAVVVWHLGRVVAGDADLTTKALLMPALLTAVLIIAYGTDREAVGAAPRSRGPIALLALAILASLAGDVLLGIVFLAGVGAFALAHLAYVVLFVGRLKTRRMLSWWTLVYPAAAVGVLALVWEHAAGLQPALAGYAVVLALTAMTASRVNALTAAGGALFFASDGILALRFFLPGFTAAFPDPWQDLAIMTLYCAGQGLIAAGVLRRLRGMGSEAV